MAENENQLSQNDQSRVVSQKCKQSLKTGQPLQCSDCEI